MENNSTTQLSKTDIVEKYANDHQSLAKRAQIAFIKTDNKNNSGKIFAINNAKGNYWIIKDENNLDFLIPQKEYRFTSHDFRTLKSFYNYEEYVEGTSRDFQLIEPARVYWNGKNWELQAKENKGVLNFGNQSSGDSKEKSEEYLAEIIEKDQQIEKLEQEKTNLEKEYQILQQQYQSLQNVNLEDFKQEIIEEMGDRFLTQPNEKLTAFKQEIIREIGDQTLQQQNIDLDSFKQEILDKISDSTPQQPDINLETFKQEILKEIGDRDIKFDNKLESIKDEIIKEIDDRKQKKKNDIESHHEPISLKELQSLIELYNSNPGLLASKSTMVAATRESIEQRRTGYNTPIIFTQTDNDSYWIVNKKLLVEDDYFYLVPKAYLIINSRIYQTIEDIFVCQNYANRSSNKFQLVQPAIVKLISDSEDYEDKWELVKPGELNFS